MVSGGKPPPTTLPYHVGKGLLTCYGRGGKELPPVYGRGVKVNRPYRGGELGVWVKPSLEGGLKGNSLTTRPGEGGRGENDLPPSQGGAVGEREGRAVGK